MACSTPVMTVDPPGCKAQSKSAAVGGELPFCSSGRDFTKSWKAGDTDAAARNGTRCERMTFQPRRTHQ